MGMINICKITTQHFDLEPYTDICYYSYHRGEFKLELVISVYDNQEVIWTNNQRELRDLPIPHLDTTVSETGHDTWWTVTTAPGENFFELDFTDFNNYLFGLTNVPDFIYNTDALMKLQIGQRGRTYAGNDGGSD